MTTQDFEHEYTIRAPRYALIQSSQICWRCRMDIPVVGFLLPAQHEQLWVDDDPSQDEWEVVDSAVVVSHISRLPASVLSKAQSASPHYRLGASKSGGEYFMNTCSNCGCVQGDFFLYSEPDGAFFLMSEGDVESTSTIAVEEPFACNGDASFSALIDLLAQRNWSR